MQTPSRPRDERVGSHGTTHLPAPRRTQRRRTALTTGYRRRRVGSGPSEDPSLPAQGGESVIALAQCRAGCVVLSNPLPPLPMITMAAKRRRV